MFDVKKCKQILQQNNCLMWNLLTYRKMVRRANNCLIIGAGSFLNNVSIHIIGSHTLVTKSIPDSVLAVGMPAKVIKENITWSREDIIFNK